MNEQTQSPTGPIDQTKHSTTVRPRNGGAAMLTRGDDGMSFLTIRDGKGVTLTAILDDENLRALLVPREQCCANCAHARRGHLGALRCHQRLRANRHGVYAPIIPNPREHVCGKFEQLARPVAREVAA